MSMNDVHHAMHRFEAELDQFNKELGLSIQQIQQMHERLKPLWRDQMRVDYDTTWKRLEEAMLAYLNLTAPENLEDMTGKQLATRRYLNGA